MSFNSVKVVIVRLIVIILGLLVFFPAGYFVLDNTRSAMPKTVHQPSHPNGVVAYIINLDRSKERYAYVEPNVRQLGYHVERISAIEGKLLSEAELNQVVDFTTYKNFLGHAPQRGTIGCSLSHIKAWQNFIQSDFEYAIIFEDDVNFNPRDLAAAVEDLRTSPQAWDLNNFETSHQGLPLTIKTFKDNKKLVIYLTEVTHAGAYIINRNAAAKLLVKALPIIMPIDHYFTRSWELNLKFTGIEPRLVAQKYGDSEIGKTSSQYTTITNEGNGLHKVMYKFQSYLIRFFYNLKTYLSDL